MHLRQEIDKQQQTPTELVNDRCNRHAVLMPNPRTLHQLRDKYTHRNGNNKAAKNFTSQEQGRCKYRYCRCKNVWDLITHITRRGDTAGSAMAKICQAYGEGRSVTKIINRIIKDHQNGMVHQQLT